MSKKKKSGDEKKLARILYITAILELIEVVMDIIKHLIE